MERHSLGRTVMMRTGCWVCEELHEEDWSSPSHLALLTVPIAIQIWHAQWTSGICCIHWQLILGLSSWPKMRKRGQLYNNRWYLPVLQILSIMNPLSYYSIDNMTCRWLLTTPRLTEHPGMSLSHSLKLETLASPSLEYYLPACTALCRMALGKGELWMIWIDYQGEIFFHRWIYHTIDGFIYPVSVSEISWIQSCTL